MLLIDQPAWGHSFTEWLTAIGGLVVAAVAVFQEWFRRLVFRPSLSLRARVDRPAAEKFKWGDGVTDIYYFRLEVSNEGNAAAKEIQVYVAGVRRLRKDGGYEVVSRFSPMNLVWAYTDRQPTLPLLLPNMPPRFCDFAHILDPGKRSVTNETLPDVAPQDAILALELEAIPSSAHLLEPGTYQFSLKLAASNYPPRDYTLEVDFPGKWFDQQDKMFSDGFGLKLIHGT